MPFCLTVTSSTPTGRSFFLARGSVNVRRTVVGPYRVRSKVSKIVIVIETPGFAWRMPKTARPRYSKKLVKNDNV